MSPKKTLLYPLTNSLSYNIIFTIKIVLKRKQKRVELPYQNVIIVEN
jgi:hypothetical protein